MSPILTSLLLGLTAAGAGWILADPRVGRNPGNLRLPKNLTWISREMEKVFTTRPRDEWLDLLEAADCPAAPVNEPGTWLDHDQVKAHLALQSPRARRQPGHGQTAGVVDEQRSRLDVDRRIAHAAIFRGGDLAAAQTV